MSRRMRCLLLLPLLLLQGCYSHTLIPVDSVPVGARVRTRVTPAEAQRLQEVVGTNHRVLRGVFVGRENGGLLFQVPAATGLGGQPLDQRVIIPQSELVEVELRELDQIRTYGLIAAVTVVVGAVVASQFAAARSDNPGPDKPSGNENRVPLLLWRSVK